MAAYADPVPGVWEIAVQSSSRSGLLDNPFDTDVTVLGASFAPKTATVPEAKAGTPAAASWKVTNKYAAVDGTLKGGPLGSSKTTRRTLAEGATRTSTVEVPKGATSLDVAIGNASDTATDLDLAVFDPEGNEVGQLRQRRLGGVGLRALAGRRYVHRRRRGPLGAVRLDGVRLPRRVLLQHAGFGHGR